LADYRLLPIFGLLTDCYLVIYKDMLLPMYLAAGGHVGYIPVGKGRLLPGGLRTGCYLIG